MLDAREIDIEIARLEYTESSYPNYAKLADLYTIRNQMKKEANSELPHYESAYSSAASEASRISPLRGDSEFLQAIDGKDNAAAWSVMDELMDTLRVVNRKVYDSVLRKIRNL